MLLAARCQPGDLWQVGRHRILCADSTNLQNLHRLIGNNTVNMVFADPPYGINVVPKSGRVGRSRNRYQSVIGDESSETAILTYQLCAALFKQAVQCWWGANYYATALPASRCWIVWDKENGSTSFADAELAWTNVKTSVRILRHKWNGAVRASERNQPRYHPCQKPVALATWFYERYGQNDDLIFDPFLGSGISLLAAEQSGQRRCYGMEILPYYCDVAIARYEQLTGQAARLIERNAYETDDDIAA